MGVTSTGLAGLQLYNVPASSLDRTCAPCGAAPTSPSHNLVRVWELDPGVPALVNRAGLSVARAGRACRADGSPGFMRFQASACSLLSWEALMTVSGSTLRQPAASVCRTCSSARAAKSRSTWWACAGAAQVSRCRLTVLDPASPAAAPQGRAAPGGPAGALPRSAAATSGSA